jgi:RNA polymerase sigma-70 factor, ECF subfamily
METLLETAANVVAICGARPDTRTSGDAALLSLVASGDKAAMHALFSKHQVSVFRFVMRRLQHREVAEDVTSEVFLEVWRNAGRFEGRSTVLTWILAIARHKAFSARPRFDHLPYDDSMEEPSEAIGDDQDAIVQHQDRSNLVRDCLTKLSADHREIIDLVYYQEQSVESIAAILGIPRNTVKTRVFYARKRLAEELKKAGVDSIDA